MRGVINPRALEAHPMLLVDCPLCDRPVPLDTDGAALECDACGIRLELAEPNAPVLADAA